MALWKLLYLATVLLVSRGLCRAYPAASGKAEKHFAKVTLDIRDVTDTSAVMDWTVPKKGRLIDSFMVSCKGKSHSLEFPASKDDKQVALKDLRPNTKYSCSLLAADETNDEEWTRIMDPIQFRTMTETEGIVSTNEPNNGDSDFLSAFKTMASKNLPLLLVCILVPVFVLAVCIGGCLIFFKVRAYRRDKEEQKRLEQLTHYKLGPKYKVNGLPPRKTKKLADQIRTKYQLPEQSQTASNTSAPRDGEEKALSPKEFNQVLTAMMFEKQWSPANQPSSCRNQQFDNGDAMTQCESEISLSSQVSPATLSAQALPLLMSEPPQWSKFTATQAVPKTRGYVSLSAMLPPIPPPSEEDIVA